ncbi:putative transcription factor TIFY family [Helianthus anomalus]
MRRNCNLELRLVPPSPPYHLRQQNSSDDINMVGGDLKGKQNQQLTIFYDGKVSVCDVTELQARTIIKLASEETDDQWRRTPGSTTSSEPSSSPLASPGLSMKRSLQRFLQKRKHRIQATSPYHP